MINEIYSAFDIPEILSFLFYPRPDYSSNTKQQFFIPVDKDISIGAKIFAADKSYPTILFFHGNGEIVSDYDDLAPVYNGMNINFIPVDYRGYGNSGGEPTVSAMMSDSLKIFNFVKTLLKENEFTGQLIVMGRSLGSASALEIAAAHQGEFAGLIIESGFAYALPLLNFLGINPESLGVTHDVIANIEKIKIYTGPTLIIHAEFDHIIPHSDGEALYNASPSPDKSMLTIPEANHNDIIALGFDAYMKAVKEFAEKLK